MAEIPFNLGLTFGDDEIDLDCILFAEAGYIDGNPKKLTPMSVELDMSDAEIVRRVRKAFDELELTDHSDVERALEGR